MESKEGELVGKSNNGTEGKEESKVRKFQEGTAGTSGNKKPVTGEKGL